ncbi:hypothetical protein KKC60_01010 [Patescibacteria group bacterium]|nr:hypothetical protein [Patescibacteria group bacterium]
MILADNINSKRLFYLGVVVAVLLFVTFLAWQFLGYFGLLGFRLQTIEPSLIFDSSTNDFSKVMTKNGQYFLLKDKPLEINLAATKDYPKTKVRLVYDKNEESEIYLSLFDNKKKKELKESYIAGNSFRTKEDFERDKTMFLPEENLLLWQNEKIFSSPEKMLEYLPIVSRKRTTTSYGVNLEDSFRLPGYKKDETKKDFPVFLRGKHTILTYIEDEILDFEFSYYDIDRKVGPDRFNILITKGGVEYGRYQKPDQEGQSEKKARMDVSGLKPGIYTVELDISDDLIISNIKTSQSEFVFRDHFFPVQNSSYSEIPGIETKPVTFFAGSDFLMFEAVNRTGLQEVLFANKNLSIDVPKAKYFYDLVNNKEMSFEDLKEGVSIGQNQRDVQKITIPQENLKIDFAGGYFALEKNNLIDNLYNGIYEENLQNISTKEVNIKPEGLESFVGKTASLTTRRKHDTVSSFDLDIDNLSKPRVSIETSKNEAVLIKKVEVLLYDEQSLGYKIYQKLFAHETGK